MNGQDTCGICEKPFPVSELRFTHFIKHVQRGEATIRIGRRGNWWFEKKLFSRGDAESAEDAKAI